MVKADTSYDKRVFVIIGGGEFLISFVKQHLPGGKPLKSGGSACFTLWGKICGICHLHISHNAPYLPSKIFHNLFFHFSCVLQPSEKKFKNNASPNLGVQIRYGRCASGE